MVPISNCTLYLSTLIVECNTSIPHAKSQKDAVLHWDASVAL